ncbi:hypothetical protein L1D15_05495 [Vibrio sp. Isolate25]|uniref:hypothetical protein n=1 Tax=Vibrio sp. Isolate25 TaxID=2908535 RepID=UPI001EFEB1FB|nr:hypothetical protein [Vibrio sp. Isolate25]MCG9596177.1 hypothetical protein [Vibrio sp. Isolate25]
MLKNVIVSILSLFLISTAFAEENNFRCDNLLGKWYSERAQDPLIMEIMDNGVNNYLVYYNEKLEDAAELTCYDNNGKSTPIASIESNSGYNVTASFGINENYLSLNVQAITADSVSKIYSMTKNMSPSESSINAAQFNSSLQPYPAEPCRSICMTGPLLERCRCPNGQLPGWH